jgi:hypothetical protein
MYPYYSLVLRLRMSEDIPLLPYTPFSTMNGRQRNATNAQIWESKTPRIMMANVRHVTSSSGLRKFQADGFLFDRVYLHSVGQAVLQVFNLFFSVHSHHKHISRLAAMKNVMRENNF